MTLSKPVIVKDPKYAKWLADSYPCLICGALSGPPHHVPNYLGQTRRSRDDFQVPLCAFHHRHFHDRPSEEVAVMGWLQGKAEDYWKEYQESKR